MKKIFLNTIFSVFALMVSLQTMAQVKEPTDPKLREMLVKQRILYKNAMQDKKYQDAANHLGWILKNVPDNAPYHYQVASDVYPKLIAELKDEKMIKAYQDTFLMSYDNYVKYFPNDKAGKPQEGTQMNYKGHYAYEYLSVRPEAVETLNNLFKKIIELNGNNTFAGNLYYAMDVTCTALANKKITDDAGFTQFEKISAVIEYNIKNNVAQKAQFEQSNELVTKKFTECFKAKITCDFIEKNLTKKYNETKSKEEAIKLSNYLSDADCTKSPLFAEIAEKLAKEDPSFDNFYKLYQMFDARGEATKAQEYFNKSQGLATTSAQKTKITKKLISNSEKAGNKAATRTYLLQLLALEPSSASNIYARIGDLYIGSPECGTKDAVEGRAYAIAAFNMYQKAGNSAKMSYAKKFYPSKADVFQSGKGGKSVTLNCWIGETVRIPLPKEL